MPIKCSKYDYARKYEMDIIIISNLISISYVFFKQYIF